MRVSYISFLPGSEQQTETLLAALILLFALTLGCSISHQRRPQRTRGTQAICHCISIECVVL